MTDILKTGEARQYPRFMVPKGTFVIVSPGTDKERKVQIIDISQDSAAFIYQGSKEDLERSDVSKLLSANPSLEKVKFETVSDKPASESMDSSLASRRRGVKFGWVGVLGKAYFRDFIKSIRI